MNEDREGLEDIDMDEENADLNHHRRVSNLRIHDADAKYSIIRGELRLKLARAKVEHSDQLLMIYKDYQSETQKALIKELKKI